MKTLIAAAIVLPVAFGVTLFIGCCRSFCRMKFQQWWNAEGLPIFIVSCLLMAALTVWRGWLF